MPPGYDAPESKPPPPEPAPQGRPSNRPEEYPWKERKENPFRPHDVGPEGSRSSSSGQGSRPPWETAEREPPPVPPPPASPPPPDWEWFQEYSVERCADRLRNSSEDLLELLRGLFLHVDHQDPEVCTSSQDSGICAGLQSLYKPPWTGNEANDHLVNGTYLPNKGIHIM